MLRLTWVQPEDLLGHELRQAEEDGREPESIAAIERRWLASGGRLAPDRAGASPDAVDPALRALAEQLLDELATLPSALAEKEPTDLAAIRGACPNWPVSPGAVAGDGAQPGVGYRGVGGERGPGRSPEGRAGGEDRASLRARLHAAWLGRAAGCVLGKPVEKVTLTGIRALARSTGNWPVHQYFTAVGVPPEVLAAHPWNRKAAAVSLAENLDGAPEDDDLNYPLLGLLLLQRHGPRFTTPDVARLWLDELPAGRTFTAERVAYRNLLSGIEPPATATLRNPFREWIGAQIRGDVFGWTNPGDPARAAELAHRDAVLSHTANGVYGEMFAAAAVAQAAGGDAGGIHACLRAGLAVVPPESRYAEAVRFGIDAARAVPPTPEGFDAAVDRLHARYAGELGYHWVHVLPNAALLAAALTHADGDYAASICRTVSGGWDTDSNGATAGSLAGLLAGSPEAIPEQWAAPLRNRLATTVAGLDGIGFDALADLTLEATA